MCLYEMDLGRDDEWVSLYRTLILQNKQLNSKELRPVEGI